MAKYKNGDHFRHDKFKEDVKARMRIGRWTEAGVAEELGMATSTLNKYFNGNKGISLEVFVELCWFFRLRADDYIEN